MDAVILLFLKMDIGMWTFCFWTVTFHKKSLNRLEASATYRFMQTFHNTDFALRTYKILVLSDTTNR